MQLISTMCALKGRGANYWKTLVQIMFSYETKAFPHEISRRGGNDINQNDPSQAIATDTAILKLMNPTTVLTVVIRPLS